ncbi:P-loop containing nucleoside triphosphate hydrolase protein [Guyanagaster necrorhizus]|uniref:P-loop containing nucleoside triphosphate hydrolase protein n=1 Tax=Guyanagaster necrorhizus TaxID=856835 RepID=A0A9P7W173_9AGAR|nr:P-loop containing nucleoside triphosphate hydrolase protein [Guyanagaster necrorhizus MCA 3950]KAG7450722.1 P-loop containing nucleoside triphosphate hydrolase protein [Guyanagaster necrorhizus MCA 3950]
MQTPRSTRSSTLGKRTHCSELPSPDPTPSYKRPKTTITVLDGDDNKENIPPCLIRAVNADAPSPISARATRALRRTTTEIEVTPSRRRAQRHTSASSLIPSPPTSPTPVSQAAISTPPMPTIVLPVHVRARALLRATCDDAVDMPARDDERAIISAFIASFVAASSLDSDDVDRSASLYISGAPGTGKTALINSILRSLDALNDVEVITINCMALSSIEALWERLYEKFEETKKPSGRTKKAARGKDPVEALFHNLKTKRLLVLDELDLITTTSQSLTTLFSLPIANPSVIRIIGIANTHTLTSFAASFSSSVQTLHFSPYTPAQLLQIIEARLVTLRNDEAEAEQVKKLLPAPALTLLTKKVAAMTGDVRSLFEALRRTIDAAVTSRKGNGCPSITPAHVLAALKTHGPLHQKSLAHSSTPSNPSSSDSEIVSNVKSLGLQARLVLLLILLSSKRIEAGLPLTLTTAAKSPSKSTGVETSHLFIFYSAVLQRGDSDVFTPISYSEFVDLIGMLDGVGLVSATSTIESPRGKGGKRSLTRTSSGIMTGHVQIASGVRPDEVLRGLGVKNADAEVSDDVMEEEVSTLWHREAARMSREMKAMNEARSQERRNPAHFSDAMEDK